MKPLISVTAAKYGLVHDPVRRAFAPQFAVVVDALAETVDIALTVPETVVIKSPPLMPAISIDIELLVFIVVLVVKVDVSNDRALARLDDEHPTKLGADSFTALQDSILYWMAAESLNQH